MGPGSIQIIPTMMHRSARLGKGLQQSTRKQEVSRTQLFRPSLIANSISLTRMSDHVGIRD